MCKIYRDNDKIPCMETEADKFWRKVKTKKMCTGVRLLLHICVLPCVSFYVTSGVKMHPVHPSLGRFIIYTSLMTISANRIALHKYI